MSSAFSTSSTLANIFPPPGYLTMPAVGIDISDYAIKFAQLKRKNKELELVSYGKVDIPLDTVVRGEIKDTDTLVKLLTRLKEEHGFSYVHLALPEEHAYLFQMDVGRGSADEIRQMVEFHLKENVPIGADEAVFDYSVIKETKKGYELNVSVYPATVATSYTLALQEAGLTPLSIEIEGQATVRSLVSPGSKKTTLTVDVGRNEASLSISTKGLVTFTANLETGGDFFTRSIARNLDISFQEAERLKRSNGFRNTTEGQPIYNALTPVVEELKEAISRHLTYWNMHNNVVSGGEQAINRVILVGGTANIEGLPEYLSAALGVSVEVGNVWKNIFSFDTYVPEMPAEKSLEFATAVGLALRSLARLT